VVFPRSRRLSHQRWRWCDRRQQRAISVTPASSTLVKLELDLDANGAYELASTMPWTFLVGAPPTTNTAPIANAGVNQKISQSTIITLDGSGSSDPDYDFLTYQWALVQKPNGIRPS
jgi:hypothetical protein